MTRRDEAALFSVKGVTDREPRQTPLRVLGKEPSYVLLTVYGSTVIHVPVFAARRRRRACNTGSTSSAAVISFSARICPRLLTAVRPSQRQAEWSAVRNYTWPLSSATKCPVTTQDAVQFSGAVWVGLGRASPACLTGRWVIPRSGTPSRRPLYNAGTKIYLSTTSTGPKASPTPGVTLCTKSPSFWRDFCSPT